MLIYGTKRVRIKTFQPKSILCRYCNVQGSVIINIYSVHFHIFWVPMFPIKKTGDTHCLHCKQSFDQGEMTSPIRSAFDLAKSKLRTPWWQFSGLVTSVLFVVWMVFALENREEKELQYLAEPAIGDVYSYRIGDFEYSMMRLAEIKNDTLYFQLNRRHAERRSRVFGLNQDKYYHKSTTCFTQEDLRGMYEDETVFSISRK